MGSNSQNVFLNGVMLHIKLKGMELRAPCKHILCPYTHPKSLNRVIKGNIILIVVMLRIKLKGKKYRLKWKQNFDLTHTLWVRLKGQILKLVDIFFIDLSTES